MAILVWYVPIPVIGTVFVGMGMVLDFSTHDIPVPNPSGSDCCVMAAGVVWAGWQQTIQASADSLAQSH